MRQVGVLAAAGLYALEHNLPKLKRDHEIAAMIAEEVNLVGQGMFKVDTNQNITNLVFVEIDPAVTNGQAFCDRLENVRNFLKTSQESSRVR